MNKFENSILIVQSILLILKLINRLSMKWLFVFFPTIFYIIFLLGFIYANITFINHKNKQDKK
jgi:hypothetical protein